MDVLGQQYLPMRFKVTTQVVPDDDPGGSMARYLQCAQTMIAVAYAELTAPALRYQGGKRFPAARASRRFTTSITLPLAGWIAVTPAAAAIAVMPGVALQ